ncbi:MAG: hypothetical protein N4A50_10470 [Vallitalea sp.]|jgi:hypothetical protein|nr:hypothetical protein [Vallitalea sp.]
MNWIGNHVGKVIVLVSCLLLFAYLFGFSTLIAFIPIVIGAGVIIILISILNNVL